MVLFTHEVCVWPLILIYKSHSHTHTGIINIAKAYYISVVCLSDMFCAVLCTSCALTFIYCGHKRASVQATV